jgi:2',3'-cyclic-nucleotide 2'-phosphodiesterase (5'-nucleotidase family)
MTLVSERQRFSLTLGYVSLTENHMDTPVSVLFAYSRSLLLITLMGWVGGMAHAGVRVQILSFNDFHGNLEPPAGSDARMREAEDPLQHDLGGSEYLSTTLSLLRQKAKHSITASAGDVIGGSPLLSGMFHDEPTVESMEALKLDVSSVGNHEFDEGLTELLRMQYGGCHPKEGCYFTEDPYDGANFPWLAANVIYSRSGKTVLPQTWIKRVGGVNIGFIGMTLASTPTLVPQNGIQGLRFENEVMAANRAVMALRKQKVRAMVILIHEGGAQTGTYNGCDGISGPIAELAKKLPAEIDLIISGHTHRAYICTLPDPNGKPRHITSASALGRAVTETWLTINPQTRDVVRAKTRASNVMVLRTVPRDPALTAVIDKWSPLYKDKANEEVGTITGDINGSPGRDTPSSLGNLVADAMLAATATPPNDAVIALINQGGIRANLTWLPASGDRRAGRLTYADLYKVLPFGNTIVTLTLTGEQIREALEQQYDPARSRPQLMLGVSEGFSFDYLHNGPQGQRIQNLTLNSQPIEMNARYRVTVGDYLAAGGDSFTAFKKGETPKGGGIDLDALKSYILSNSPVAPPPDRIRWVEQ